MPQQQPNFDPWTNSNQSSWGGGNPLAVARAPADVFARTALIIRTRALLEEAMAAPATPVRQFLIEVARFRLAERMETTSTVTSTPPPSPLLSIILDCDLVLCSKPKRPSSGPHF